MLYNKDRVSKRTTESLLQGLEKNCNFITHLPYYDTLPLLPANSRGKQDLPVNLWTRLLPCVFLLVAHTKRNGQNLIKRTKNCNFVVGSTFIARKLLPRLNCKYTSEYIQTLLLCTASVVRRFCFVIYSPLCWRSGWNLSLCSVSTHLNNSRVIN